jgi:hypothetical protein
MKKALSVLLVAAGLVVAGISTGSTAMGSGPKATAAGQKTYSKFTSKKLYKPGTFFFGAHEVIENVSWSKWGKKLAEGTGTYQVNDCIPYCAAGTIHPTPSTIYLTGRERCGKIFVFSRMKVYFAGHKRTSQPFCKT